MAYDDDEVAAPASAGADAYCVGCGAAPAVGGRHVVDTDGRAWCSDCVADLRQTPLEAADGSTWVPAFRCGVCGTPVPADQLDQWSQGWAVCRSCRAAAASRSARGSGGEGTNGRKPDTDPSGVAARAAAVAKAAADAQDVQQVLRQLGRTVPPNLLARVTCPHCWHGFRPDEFLWVSQHADLLGDPVLGPEAQVRFRPSRFNLRGEALDGRDQPCQQLACPRCHLVVPRALAEAEPLFVSVVGVPASGKSHLLAAMTWALRRRLPADFGVGFGDADTVSNRALNDFEQALFLPDDPSRPVALLKTELHGEMYDQVRLGAQAISLPRPFLFAVRPASAAAAAAAGSGEVPSPPSPGPKPRVLCLYDNAGEHFAPGMDSAASPGTQHLARAALLMFLFDPTQHPRFRDRCRPLSSDPQLAGGGRVIRQELALAEAAARVRRYTGLSQAQRHDRTLVVVVAKSDIWAPLLGGHPRDPLTADPSSPGRAALDLDVVDQVSAAVRRLLQSFTPELVAAAEDFCTRVVYLPASALGRSPEPDAATGLLGVRPQDVEPRWVTVPILYALATQGEGLLPAVRGGRPIAPAAGGASTPSSPPPAGGAPPAAVVQRVGS